MKNDVYQQLSFLADKANIGLESILHDDKQIKLLNFGILFCDTILKIFNDKTYLIDNKNLKSSIFDDDNRNDKLSKLGINSTNIIPSIKIIKDGLEEYISKEKTPNIEEIQKLQDKIYWISIYFYKYEVQQTNILKEKQSLNAYG